MQRFDAGAGCYSTAAYRARYYVSQSGCRCTEIHLFYFRTRGKPYGKGKLQFDANGLLESTWIGDLPYNRLVEKNGKPLKGKELAKEQAKYDKAIADHSGFRSRTPEGVDVTVKLKLLLTDTYSLREIQQEVLSGVTTHVIECAPANSATTRHVVLWVTDKGVVLREMYTVVTDETDKLRGSTMQGDYQLINGDLLPQRSVLHLVHLSGNTTDCEDTYSRFREFNVSVKLHAGPKGEIPEAEK